MGLELGECLLDGIEIGAVGRQEQEPAFVALEGSCGGRAAVRREVIEDDDGSRLERGSKLGRNIDVEDFAVHCAFDHPGRDDAVAGQTGDEGLGIPFAEWSGAVEPFSDRRPAPEPGEAGLHGSFVDEHQTVRLATHARLAAGDPFKARGANIGTLTLGCDQAFFYMKGRRA